MSYGESRLLEIFDKIPTPSPVFKLKPKYEHEFDQNGEREIYAMQILFPECLSDAEININTLNPATNNLNKILNEIFDYKFRYFFNHSTKEVTTISKNDFLMTCTHNLLDRLWSFLKANYVGSFRRTKLSSRFDRFFYNRKNGMDTLDSRFEFVLQLNAYIYPFIDRSTKNIVPNFNKQHYNNVINLITAYMDKYDYEK